MIITISEDGSKKYNLDIGASLLLASIYYEKDLEVPKKELISKGYITTLYDNTCNKIGWRVTNEGRKILESIIIDSDKPQEKPKELDDLAKKIKDIFPKGKNIGGYYWSEGIPLIVLRLKAFFRKYGKEYTDEQILDATKRYVESFNGDYRFMKLLKYFIFKEKVGAGGDRESESELLTYIENANSGECEKNDWDIQLR